MILARNQARDCERTCPNMIKFCIPSVQLRVWPHFLAWTFTKMPLLALYLAITYVLSRGCICICPTKCPTVTQSRANAPMYKVAVRRLPLPPIPWP